jgi:hypothetical protein
LLDRGLKKCLVYLIKRLARFSILTVLEKHVLNDAFYLSADIDLPRSLVRPTNSRL